MSDSPLQVRLSDRLRGDVRWRPTHIFAHQHRIGRWGTWRARAWRQKRGSHLCWEFDVFLFGWRVGIDANSTSDHPKFGHPTPEEVASAALEAFREDWDDPEMDVYDEVYSDG